MKNWSISITAFWCPDDFSIGSMLYFFFSYRKCTCTNIKTVALSVSINLCIGFHMYNSNCTCTKFVLSTTNSAENPLNVRSFHNFESKLYSVGVVLMNLLSLGFPAAYACDYERHYSSWKRQQQTLTIHQ